MDAEVRRRQLLTWRQQHNRANVWICFVRGGSVGFVDRRRVGCQQQRPVLAADVRCSASTTVSKQRRGREQ